jgi:hypothetical protein
MMPARGRVGRGRSSGEEFAMSGAWFRVTVFALVVLSIGSLAFRPASAQEATPTARSEHPLVGAWALDRDTSHPTNPQQLVIVTADGLYFGVEYGGRTTAGVWEATGPRTAAITLRVTDSSQSVPFLGLAIIRGTVEVAEDGLSFTSPYTLEIVAPDGTSSGEHGVTTARGVRVTIEDMGDPVGTLEELESATPTP